MAEFTLSQVVEATQGTSAHTDNIKFLDESTDTRTIESGFLFVALKGDTFDGHDFINAAIEKGATGAIVEKGRFSEIEKILTYFSDKVREYKKIGVAYVISAVELSKDEKQEIVQKLLNTTSYVEFIMNYSVDASLIGGVVIRIGDRVVDSSIRSKLNRMAKELSQVQLTN